MAIDFTRYPNNVLPLPLLKNHSLKRMTGMLETKMDSGFSRRRRRFKNRPAEMTAVFQLSSYELEIFEGWFEHVIHGGQDRFVMPIKVASGVIDHQCQFTGDGYTAKPISQGLWSVNAKIKAYALVGVSADEVISRIHNLANPTQVVRDGVDQAVEDYVN